MGTWRSYGASWRTTRRAACICSPKPGWATDSSS